MTDAHSKRPHDGSQPSAPINATSLPQRSRPISDQQGGLKLAQSSSKAAKPSDDHDNDDDDYTSSSGSDSSDEDEDDNEEGEKDQMKMDDGNDHALPRIPARQKPNITRMQNDGDLLSRLSAFLPKMKTANDDLQREIEAGGAKDVILDDVDDEQHDGQYIEMNLGLGVLEEKQDNDNLSQRVDSDQGLETANSSEQTRESQNDSNNLDKLMGHEGSSSKKPTIEEMRD